MDHDVINPDKLYDLIDSIGEEAIETFIHRFKDDCQNRVACIVESYEENDLETVELEAHTLGSTAAIYGAQKLEALCREIEAADKERNEIFQQRIDRLNDLSAKTIEAFSTYLDDDDEKEAS